MNTGVLLSRRDRNKAAKREAIARAAARLFAERGYAATTTLQVAAEADVAEGTLFRYAGTKPELLLMVINEHLRPLVDLSVDAQANDPVDEILLLLGPLISLAESQPDNAAPFLREVLFGEDGPERDESLAIVDRMIARIGTILAPHLDGDVDMTLDEVARWGFSALVSELLRDVVGRTDGGGDRQLVLRTRVRVLLRGLGAA